MAEQPEKSEMDEYYERTRRPLFKNPTTLRGKIGCGILLVLWFSFLTLPCAMFWLASGRSFTLPRFGDVPQAHQYPSIQLSLIMTQENRGLQFTNTSVRRNGSNNLCVEANINYLLWASEDDQNAATYCDCYERSDADANWQLLETTNTRCNQ